MKINPIKLISEPIKREIAQRKEFNKFTNEFLEQYGDKFLYYSKHRNRKAGSYAVLGSLTKNSPFSHAMAKLKDGTIIQTVVLRDVQIKDELTDSVLKVTQKPDGTLNVLKTIVHKLGLNTWCEKQQNSVVIKPKVHTCRIFKFPFGK